MFEAVLIANRGEIAVRIAKTLRKMGIRSVVTASIPDRRSLAVRTADDWVLLEGYSAAESYLDMDAVIAAAKDKGCQAIHPGYGFLSERADFAERCASEGIVFVGPTPEVLRGLGDKAAARKLATENGVPVVPGWDGEDDPETLAREAARIGYPVMLKARGGGGGRGMREVFSTDELPEAIESARREALAAFGDGGLLLERLVTNAHHVEVQILADTHGNVIHLGERDCSVQRRHQKLIEESPSPVVDDALRQRLTGYALTLARAINYTNAGTFEFLVVPPATEGSLPRSQAWERGPGGDGQGAAAPGKVAGGADVYFLEVNPRLQVEHPVTEMVTGLDLVELQLRIAAGEPLPLKQEDVTFTGHAIEFRINAEDPWDGFKPSSGRIERAHWGELERHDAGYADGDDVPSQYDSLAGKLVCHGDARANALGIADVELSGTYLVPLRTNVPLHEAILANDTFRAGTAGVAWLEQSLDALLEAPLPPPEAWAAAAASLAAEALRASATPQNIWLDDGAIRRAVLVQKVGDDFVATSEGASVRGSFRGTRLVDEVWDREVTVSVAGSDYGFRVSQRGMFGGLEREGRVGLSFTLVPPPPLPRRVHAATEGVTAITAPLSGTVAAVRVAEGDSVEAGQLLLVLEAMKMEHRITAPAAGTVKSLPVRERDTVGEGDILVELA